MIQGLKKQNKSSKMRGFSVVGSECSLCKKMLEIESRVTSIVQYPGAADLTHSNFHFFAAAIVHIQQT